MATATLTDLQTLPARALAAGLPIDRLREMLRARADLRALGVRIGATIGYTAEAFETIRAAYSERNAR